MGGLMHGWMYGWMVWMVLYGLLGLVLIVGGCLLVARVIGRRSLRPDEPGPPKNVGATQPDEALAALRRRYAAGEISREDYLQAKVELED